VTVLRGSVPGWCGQTPAALDPDWPVHLEHAYPKPGRYRVFAVVHTATCEGGDGTSATSMLQMDA
jgi:hypothetical protein